MGDVGEVAELTLEQVDRGGIRAKDCLERDVFLAVAIVGLIHRSHAARAEMTADLEARRPMEVRLGVGHLNRSEGWAGDGRVFAVLTACRRH